MILAYFWCSEGALGATFLILAAQATGLNIECFSRSPWGSRMGPQKNETLQPEQKWGFGSAPSTISRHWSYRCLRIEGLKSGRRESSGVSQLGGTPKREPADSKAHLYRVR